MLARRALVVWEMGSPPGWPYRCAPRNDGGEPSIRGRLSPGSGRPGTVAPTFCLPLDFQHHLSLVALAPAAEFALVLEAELGVFGDFRADGKAEEGGVFVYGSAGGGEAGGGVFAAEEAALRGWVAEEMLPGDFGIECCSRA